MGQTSVKKVPKLSKSENDMTTVMDLIDSQGYEYVDFRFTDTLGIWHHLAFHHTAVNRTLLQEGVMFDGSSIKGWKGIEDSDMCLKPSGDAYYPDPFALNPTLIMICNVDEPSKDLPYNRDPRSTALAAEEYLRKSGIADEAYFGPEPEFFIFDEVHFETGSHASYYAITSEEGPYPGGPIFGDCDRGQWANGHRPPTGGGYFPVSPVDQGTDLRAEMINVMNEMGIRGEKSHHEVAVSQHEIGFQYSTLTQTADNLQTFKYCVKNVAHENNKTATFMPKPVFGDNGSGMHVHMSLSKEGAPLFLGNKYNGLSQEALYFVGGILKHARALNAFTNPTTNSYKRLVPGFEAPIFKAYSARNRSAAVRIPHVNNPKAKRIEVRFPDPTANGYLALAAMLMAGLDGIENKIDPGPAMEKNLFAMDQNDLGEDDLLCTSLCDALRELDKDRDFLLKGEVFSEDQIDSYIELRKEQMYRINEAPHPLEFQLYYSS